MKSGYQSISSMYEMSINVAGYATIALIFFILFADVSLGYATEKMTGFSFDCENTNENPCRRIVGLKNGNIINIEASSAVWSDQYKKVIVVSDNFNDLVGLDAREYVIVSFALDKQSRQIYVKPLLTKSQIEQFHLYDLEGVSLRGNRLYAIGSLALHGKEPNRDRWERHQFIQLDLKEKNGQLYAENLSHVTNRWPNFRDWLISKSGYKWTGEAIRGRAEGEGINVEALSATVDGNLLIGFRGPLTENGGVLAIEIKLPTDDNDEPVLVQEHIIPALDDPHIPNRAAKTLRAISMIPDEPGHYYVLLGPKGYGKENLVLVRWNLKIGALTKATLLPDNFLAEGVTPLPGGKVLVVDDLNGGILIATE
jgi:hypothetical protein